ncbi:hypothetical protein OPIT5_21835 [Opitutaceae bacterium TAV5]|nr:hypothetical protein OPIT5_21835 [Opitutaceae bacterium TAV5]
MVKQAVGKLGLAVIVLTPDAEPLTASIDTTIRIRPRIVVEVVENGGMNKTGLAALDVVAELLPVLHRAPNGFQPAGQPRRPGLHEITLDPKVPYELVPDDMLVVYHVNTSTEITLSRSPAAPDPAP